MSAFDDLMNLGGTTETSNQSDDPFDLLGTSETTNQNTANTGGSLLDLGFDVQVSTKNEPVEVNTNPLYEFTKSNDTPDIMASEADSVLLDFGGGEPQPQKEVKTDSSSNPLYDFLESEQTNGHVDDEVVLTNGDAQTLDLLDNSNDQVDLLGGPITVTSDDSGVTMDINNISETREEDITTEDVVEVEEAVKEVEEEEEEVEDDQDTGNVEDIGSEQTTEPEIDDEQDEGPVKDVEDEPEIVSEPAPVGDIQEDVVDDKEALDVGTNDGVEEVNSNEAGDTNEEGRVVEEVQKIDEEIEEKIETQDEPVQESLPQSVEVEDVKVDEVEDAENVELVEQQTSAAVDQMDVNEEAVVALGNDDKVDTEELTPAELSGEAAPDMEPEEAQVETTTDPVPVPVEPVPQPEEVMENEMVENVETAPVQEDVPDIVQQSADIEDAPEPYNAEPDVLQNTQADQLPEIAVEEQQPEMETITEDKEPESVSEEVSSQDIGGETESVGDAEPIVETVVEDQAVEERSVKEPAVKEPAVEEPAVEEPAVEEPAVTEPAVEEPAVEEPAQKPDNLELADDGKKKAEDIVVKETVVETKNAPEPTEEKAVKVNGTNDVKENGLADEEVIRDPNIVRETREKEEVHFAELNNFRQKFESGAVAENEPTPKKVSVRDEYDEGGEFENTPAVNEDVVKETDQQKEELPEVGMAKNLLSKFKTLQEENAQTVTSQKRNSPPRDEKVEYESQPTERIVLAESKSDEGVFESTPKENENVVRSGDKAEDVKTAEGHTKGLLNRFKEIETESSAYKTREKRELTPDKSGKVEYVSEPRGEHITYDDNKVETGVYENVPKEEEDVVRSGDKAEEAMPESGMAANLLSKFKQLESETVNNAPPSPKRGKPYEPKPREQAGYLERYSPKLEEGEFESQPVIPAEVVRSGDVAEDVKPEAGIAKKTLERFKSMEQTGSPPKAPDYRKDFTPPRETSPGKTVAGVVENQPEVKPDVVRNVDKPTDELPEQGTAKNILERFKQIQSSENSPSESPTKKHKEFTPPPEAGVYENTPKEHLVIEQRQSESGVLESTPTKSAADIPREEREIVSPEKEMPEKGMAKNLVSKFKQLESESAKTSQSTSPRYKEFTPPRDTKTILSPKSPAEHQNGVHPSDLPEQYQEQTSPGIFESSPEVRKDVYRESDTDYGQGLPAKNTTMSMLEKFRNIQQKAKEGEETPVPVSKKSTAEMEADKEIEIEIIEKPTDNGTDDTNNVKDNHSAPGDNVDVDVEFSVELNPDSDANCESEIENNVNVEADDVNVEAECVPQIESENDNNVDVDVVITIGNGEEGKDEEVEYQIENDEGISNENVQDENVDGENVSTVVPDQDKEKTMNGGDGEKVEVIVGKEADVDETDETDAKVEEDPQENKENVKEKEPNNNTPSVMSSIAKFGTRTPKKDAGMFRVVQTEKCAACQKTVYAMEKLEMNGNAYHKTCFKCSHCSARLTPKTFSMNEGVIYCLTHFKQLFTRKGNYDEGFGRQQYKKKWGDDKSKDSTATA